MGVGSGRGLGSLAGLVWCALFLRWQGLLIVACSATLLGGAGAWKGGLSRRVFSY